MNSEAICCLWEILIKRILTNEKKGERRGESDMKRRRWNTIIAFD